MMQYEINGHYAPTLMHIRRTATTLQPSHPKGVQTRPDQNRAAAQGGQETSSGPRTCAEGRQSHTLTQLKMGSSVPANTSKKETERTENKGDDASHSPSIISAPWTWCKNGTLKRSS